MSDSDDAFDLYNSPDKDPFAMDMDDSLFAQNFFATRKNIEKDSNTNTVNTNITTNNKEQDNENENEKEKEKENEIKKEKEEQNNNELKIQENKKQEEKTKTLSTNISPSSTDIPNTQTNSSKKSSSIYIAKLPWWTTDVQLEEILTKLNFKWKELRFYDNKVNGKLGYVYVDFGDPTIAFKAKNALNGKYINGEPCLIQFASNHNGRFAPTHQTSTRREERQLQSNPYQPSKVIDRRTTTTKSPVSPRIYKPGYSEISAPIYERSSVIRDPLHEKSTRYSSSIYEHDLRPSSSSSSYSKSSSRVSSRHSESRRDYRDDPYYESSYRYRIDRYAYRPESRRY